MLSRAHRASPAVRRRCLSRRWAHGRATNARARPTPAQVAPQFPYRSFTPSEFSQASRLAEDKAQITPPPPLFLPAIAVEPGALVVVIREGRIDVARVIRVFPSDGYTLLTGPSYSRYRHSLVPTRALIAVLAEPPADLEWNEDALEVKLSVAMEIEENDIVKHARGTCSTLGPYSRSELLRHFPAASLYFLHEVLWPVVRPIHSSVFSVRSLEAQNVMRGILHALSNSAGLNAFLERLSQRLLKGPRGDYYRVILSRPAKEELLKQALPPEDAPYISAIAYAATLRTPGAVYPPPLRRLFRPLRSPPVAAMELLVDALIPHQHVCMPEFSAVFLPDEHMHLQRPLSPHTKSDGPRDNSIGLVRRNVPEIAYAIDNPETTEVDDAISLQVDGQGREWLVVHVADVASVIDPLSVGSREAERRATSVYLPHVHHAMLHPELVEAATLRANAPSRTLCIAVLLSDAGEPLDMEIFSATTNIVRLSYTDAQAALDGEGEHSEALRTLQKLTSAFRRFRSSEAHALFRLVRAPKIRVENGIVRLVHEEAADAHALVEDAMVLAGHCVAVWAHAERLPIAYRTQVAPDEVTDESYEGLVLALRRLHTMSAAVLSASPSPHYTLNLQFYSRVTSPLRRYADLVTHWQILAKLRGQEVPFAADDLEARLQHVHYVSKQVDNLQRYAERYWTSCFLRQNLDERPLYRGKVYAISEPVRLPRRPPLKDQVANDSSVRIVRYFIPDLGAMRVSLVPINEVRDTAVGHDLMLRAHPVSENNTAYLRVANAESSYKSLADVNIGLNADVNTGLKQHL